MPRTAAHSNAAPDPVGPYSHSVRIGSMVAASGQAGITPGSAELREGIDLQTRQTLENLNATLAASGASLDDVLHVRVYLTKTSDFDAMNEAYRAYFTEPYPARTTVYVNLPAGLLVEIDALAIIPSI
jgi:2-iminobutanoate/2-iminopropanoate deaminase